MSSTFDEKDSFKTQWNHFTTYVYDFIEKRFGESNEEKQNFKKKLSDCSAHSERIEFILQDEEFKRCICSKVDEAVAKLPLPQKEQNFYEMAKRRISDMQYGDYRKMVDAYCAAISLLLSDMSNPLSYDLLVDCLLKRADLLYLLERYEDCYEDINELKTMSVSSEDMLLIPALEERCLQNLSKVHRVVKPNEIKAKNENPVLECCTVDAEMIHTDEKGRAVKSTNYIPEKTIIAAEDPFVCWLRPNAYNEYCNHCLIKLNSRYIFCNDCVIVRYCSVECREKAWNDYHDAECRYVNVLKDWAMGHIALRMAIVAGVNTVIKMEKEDVIKPLENWTQKGFRNDYTSVHSLTGEQCLIDDYYTAAAVGAALIAIFSSRMHLIEENSPDFFLYGGAIFKHIAQVYLNTYTIYDQDIKHTPFENIFWTTDDRIKVGVALYASCSLFSHSCENNCLKYYCGSKIILVNTIPINANEEITVNYGTCSSQSTIQDRADFLMANFGFECKCEACQVNLECIAYSFICPLCKGPLVYNENGTNYCSNCLQEEIDVTDLLKVAEQSKKLLSDGEQFAAAGDLEKAKDSYLKTEQLCKQIYYSPNRLFGIHSSLAVIYEAKSNYYKAYKYKRVLNELVAEIYGDESLELIDHLVECGKLLKKVAKQVMLKKRKYLKKSETYFEEAFKLFTRASKVEFQIISNNRTSFADYMTT